MDVTVLCEAARHGVNEIAPIVTLNGLKCGSKLCSNIGMKRSEGGVCVKL